jgi:alpha-glutamyl/putrescinyl thymine pyrophosphorylase clade 1
MTKEVELSYWINERYQMKLRHDSELPHNKTEGGLNLPSWKYGWSDDPIMGTTRWCNVHREDDRVTKWLAKYWRPEHHAVWEIVLARMLNYAPTLARLLVLEQLKTTQGWTLENIAAVLKARRDSGDKVFTSAYTISTCGKSMDKIDYVVDWVVRAMQKWEHDSMQEDRFESLAICHRWLQRVDGLGSFLAGQVLADLKNTAGHPLQAAPDWWTWACPGPGSLRGLEAFYGHKIAPSGFSPSLVCVKELTLPLLNESIPRICMQDWQNCMCEFSKYMKLKEGRGHARNRYSALG